MTCMPAADAVPSISKPLLGLFRYIVRGYFRRGFHGVRMHGEEHLRGAKGPLIVYANHASWWDPLLCFLLSERLMPERAHFSPMDAAALERYAVFKRLGVFGVDVETARGAVQFLRTGMAVLGRGGVLWMTPQGQFVDVRVRPLTFKSGLAALAARVAKREGECTVLPLAVEYPFWDERTPEGLLEFGEAIKVGPESADLEGRFEAALANTMDCLKGRAMKRDAREFTTLMAGRAGTGGMYALGQRFHALVTGRRYRAEHTIVRDGR